MSLFVFPNLRKNACGILLQQTCLRLLCVDMERVASARVSCNSSLLLSGGGLLSPSMAWRVSRLALGLARRGRRISRAAEAACLRALRWRVLMLQVEAQHVY